MDYCEFYDNMHSIDYSIEVTVAGQTKTVQMSWLTLNEETQQLQFADQKNETVVSIEISDLFPDFEKDFLMTLYGKSKDEKTHLMIDVSDNCLLLAQTTDSITLKMDIITELERYFCFDFRNNCRVFFNDVYNAYGDCSTIQIVRKESTGENGGRPKFQIIRASRGLGGSGCDYYDSL